MRLIFFLLAVMLCGCCKQPTPYTNPLSTADGKEIHIADPFIYHHEGMYYLTGTTQNGELNSFEYFTSPDMVTWSHGGILFKPANGHIGVAAFWAPEVKYYKGMLRVLVAYLVISIITILFRKYDCLRCCRNVDFRILFLYFENTFIFIV